MIVHYLECTFVTEQILVNTTLLFNELFRAESVLTRSTSAFTVYVSGHLVCAADANEAKSANVQEFWKRPEARSQSALCSTCHTIR